MGRRESWTEGEGVSRQGSAEAWERKKCKSSKKVWGGNTHSQHPQLGKYKGGGGGKGEWRGTQGYPLFAGMGGSESHHTQKGEKGEKEGERAKDGCSGGWGKLRVGPGDPPYTTVLARARRAEAERPALSSGPAPSFLWAAGGDRDRPPPFPFRAGGKGVCVCVSVLGGAGVHPEACSLPRTP